MLRRMLATTNDLTFTVARLVLGVTFFIHGAQKMLGWLEGFGFHLTSGQIPLCRVASTGCIAATQT